MFLEVCLPFLHLRFVSTDVFHLQLLLALCTVSVNYLSELHFTSVHVTFTFICLFQELITNTDANNVRFQLLDLINKTLIESKTRLFK